VTETPAPDYNRGVIDGIVQARMDEFDRHFGKINGSIDNAAAVQHDLKIAIERLIAQGTARDAAQVERDKAALAMAVALEKRGDRAWSPWQRLVTVAAVLVAVASLLFSALR
jgi:hypothetical protein